MPMLGTSTGDAGKAGQDNTQTGKVTCTAVVLKQSIWTTEADHSSIGVTMTQEKGQSVEQ